MTPFQLKLALKSHGMHVYEDTGGIYTADGAAFIGSISNRDYASIPSIVETIRLNRGKVDSHPEHVNALRAICVINNINLTGFY